MMPSTLALAALVVALVSGPVRLESLDDAGKTAVLVQLRTANGHFDAGRFAEALAVYESLALQVALPEVHLRRATTCERLGRYAEAAAALRTYLELSPGAPDAGRAGADITRLDALARAANSATLRVTTRPPGAEVHENDPRGAHLGQAPLELIRPAGELTLHVSSPGYLAETRPLLLRAGEETRVDFVLVPAPAPAPPAPAPTRLRPWGYGVLGLGGVLLIGAGVLGYTAQDRIDEANAYDRSAAGHTRSALEKMQAEIPPYETGFYVTGGLGLAAVLTGAGLLLFADDGSVADPGGAE